MAAMPPTKRQVVIETHAERNTLLSRGVAYKLYYEDAPRRHIELEVRQSSSDTWIDSEHGREDLARGIKPDSIEAKRAAVRYLSRHIGKVRAGR